STAILAGVAALVRAKFPQLSAQEVIHRMTATAVDKGPAGRDELYGYGLVDPVAALTADVPPLGGSSSPTSASAASSDVGLKPKSTSSTALLVGVGLLLAAGAVTFAIAMVRRSRL
ncbi:MAG: type VII secretion-associated serine protease, partial [Dactylosporangium sp.]|nr:type VII secretion-associated serine protease [Dactylosporangium sp.]NNJ62749.1 type VII secretion-associated serine protease [Dactylosporangium sp.]